MLKTQPHRAANAGGTLILVTVFLALLASLSLPLVSGSGPEDPSHTLSINLSETEAELCYTDLDVEHESPEQLDVHTSFRLPAAFSAHTVPNVFFSAFLLRLQPMDGEIRIPPPKRGKV